MAQVNIKGIQVVEVSSFPDTWQYIERNLKIAKLNYSILYLQLIGLRLCTLSCAFPLFLLHLSYNFNCITTSLTEFQVEKKVLKKLPSNLKMFKQVVLALQEVVDSFCEWKELDVFQSSIKKMQQNMKYVYTKNSSRLGGQFLYIDTTNKSKIITLREEEIWKNTKSGINASNCSNTVNRASKDHESCKNSFQSTTEKEGLDLSLFTDSCKLGTCKIHIMNQFEELFSNIYLWRPS